MPQERPIFEDEVTQRLPHIISVSHPMPIPDTAWNEEPTRCLRVNAKWASYILGVMDSLDQPDAWAGTDTEIFDARQQIREIMLQLMSEEVCETMPPEYLKGVVGCENGVIEFTRVVSGEEESIFLDVGSCMPQLPHIVTSIAGCESGIIEVESIDFGVSHSNFLNLSSCLEGEFARPGDIPTLITPVPSLIGTDLWFDMDGDSDPDVNVGRVVGYDGSNGSDGNDAPLPSFALVGDNLYVDPSGGIDYQDLGVVRGLPGEDGECETCDLAPAPEQTDVPGNEGLMCSISLQEAAYVRRLWDKAYNDTENIISGYIGGLITGASVIAYFFPAVAVGGALLGIAMSIFKNITELESNAFDDPFEDAIRCSLYCILKAHNTTVIDETVRTEWVAEIRTYADVYQEIAAQLIEVTPLTELQWVAYASSEIDEAACAECDCDEDEPCEGTDTINVVVTNGTFYATDFILPEGCCYKIAWSGTVRVGGTAGSPIMGDGNRQQSSAGSSSWVTSGDILQWNNGSGWTRLPTATDSRTGYEVIVPSTGVALNLRWFAANYANNAGTMTVTVTGEECPE